MRMNFGEKFFDREKILAAAQWYFGKAKECGVNTIVDGTPVNLGRDVPLIKEVAERTGLNFIVSSGFYYQEEPWLQQRSEDEIYNLLIDECRNGIQGTGVLPGILKCAVDKKGVTELIGKLLKATARAAAESGLPVFCHTAPEVHSGDRALDILIEGGVEPHRIIAGHCGDTDDVDYLETLLKRGVYLGIDRFGMSDYWQPPYDGRGIRLLKELMNRGWEKQLLLSHDTAAFLGFGYEDEPGWENRERMMVFSRIHRIVIPALESEGISPQRLISMLTDNVRRLFESE